MSQVDHTSANKSDPFLLATKLAIPSARADVLVRPRLVNKIQAAVRGPLTLLTASAGFGKTTLLSTVLRDSQWPTIWVSLESSDDDLNRFWSYVFAALESVQPGVSKAARSLLQAPGQLSIEAVLTTLINTLLAFQQDINLVLDDYHCMTAQSIHASLAFFLEHQPPHLHVIIATRTDPLLPLARWRVRGQLTEIRSSDLRFTTEEIAAFFQRSHLQLSDEEVHALDTRTEGWIAGLQLAALSLQGRKDTATFIKAFTGSHRYIVDYLIQEVFALQTPVVQTFLVRTSILERLCGSLCEAVSGQAGGQALLEQVEQANLFLQPLDDERYWYRYHSLFAELLRYRLTQEQPDLLPLLHHQASTWYEQHDLLSEAINHALAAADFRRAAQLIEKIALHLTKRGELMTVSTWLRKLPAEEIQSLTGLAVLQGWLFFLTGQDAAAEGQLQEIEQRHSLDALRHNLANGASPPAEMQPLLHLLGEIAAIRASIAILQEDGAGTIEFAREALVYLPEQNTFRGLVTWYLGLAYWIAGDPVAAVQAMSEAYNLNVGNGNLYMGCMATHELASIEAAQGYLQQAEQTYQQAIQLAQHMGTLVLGPIHVGLGNLHYEWNNLEAAERFLQEGIEQCLHMENTRTALEGAMTLALLRQALGQQESVQASAEKISQLARNPNIPPSRTHFVAAFQARLALMQHDQPTVQRWLQRCGLHAHDVIDPLRFNEYLILARVLLAQGNFDDAFLCLRQLFALAEARGRIKSTIEIFSLQALAYQAQGNTAMAQQLLEHALLLAEPGSYIRLFVDEGAPLASLLEMLHRTLQEQAPAPKQERTVPSLRYLEKLLTAFHAQRSLAPNALLQSAQSASIETNKALAEPLHARELEVLRLIAEGCSNREIADRLVLALSTVKWYVNIIYGKLQVESRTRAVARARELKLL